MPFRSHEGARGWIQRCPHGLYRRTVRVKSQACRNATVGLRQSHLMDTNYYHSREDGDPDEEKSAQIGNEECAASELVD